MKIMTLVSEYPSYGDEIPNTFVHKYLKALQKNGVEAYVLLMDFRSIRRKRKLGLSTYEYDGVKVYRYAFPCGPVPHLREKLMRSSVCKLYRYAEKKEGKPDIVHAHFGTMGYVASRLKEKFGLPYIVTEHSTSLMSESADVNDSRHRYYFKGYKDSHGIVCVSSSLKRKIESLDGSLSVNVIPNILSDAFSYRECEKYEDFTVVSVGRLVPIKRFDLLIRAVACLREGGESVRLKIIGDGTQKESLVALAESLGVDAYVELTGVKTPDEICDVFNRSHVFALTSDIETFGVVYIEANACGLPCIASDCGGPSDIINESNGVIIPKNDVAALSETILSVKHSQRKYDPETISDRTRSCYGDTSIVKEYMKIYGETV